MNSVDRAAAHIGRVGALAMALGIGAAVATGTGTAWADSGSRGNGPDTSEQTTAGPDAGAVPIAPVRRAPRGPVPADAGVAPRTAPAASDPVAVPDVDIAAPATRGSVTADGPTAVAPAGPVAPDNDSPANLPRPAASAQLPADLPAVSPSEDRTTPTVRVQPAATAARTLAPAPAPAAAAEQIVALPAAAAPVIAPVAATPPAVRPAAAPVAAFASRLLAAVGLGPLAGNGTPGAPLDSPALWALLGWVRREPTRVRSVSARTALPSATVATALVATQPGTLPSTPVGWVTGQRNSAFPGAGWTQTNNTRWANVYGTDLGIMWFNGVNGKTQLAFGDTFSGPNMSGDWRSNVLLLSDDTNLTDGLSLINTGPAFQFIPAARNQVFFIGSEVTNIPTSALYANNNNYVNYMSVKSWDTPGRWTTNYSAISQYDPATDKWVLQRSTIRSAGWFRAQQAYRAGDQNFQQMAYVVQPESKVAPGETRYVYAFGTPAGRAGSAYLSRVPEGEVTNLRKYEYWNGTRWVDDQARATAVIGDSTTSTGLFGWAIDIANNPNFFGGWFAGFTGAKTGGNVSEMSVQYNEYLDKYVVLYGNGANNVILRTADSPEGPWSDPVTIATSLQYPGLYAPMIHPLSGTGQLTDGTNPDVNNLYWNMSLWGNYNVVLMKTDLSPLKVTPV